MDNLTLTQYSKSSIAMQFDEVRAGWEKYVLLVSDLHIDSVHFREDAFRKIMGRALELDAPILINGDTCDLMQGRSDGRRSNSEMRPELLGDNYINLTRNFVGDMLMPYSSNIVMLGDGNHETAGKRHYGVDINELVAEYLRAGNPECEAVAAGYSGNAVLKFKIRNTVSQRMDLRWFHGAGGGGRSSRGVTNVNFRAAYSHADIFWTGHIHHFTIVPIRREYVMRTAPYDIYYKDQWHICTPSFQAPCENPNAFDGFQIEKELGPRPSGGALLHFTCDGNGVSMNVQMATF